MSVRAHRVAAATIFGVGLVVVVGWARSQTIQPERVRAVLDRLQGDWVASLVQAGETRKLEGEAARSCRVAIRGKTAVFHHLVDADEARGTFFIDPLEAPAKVDFKLDAGWICGVFEVDGDELRLCVNSLAPLEKLGVPSQPRPKAIEPGERRHTYVFRRIAELKSSR